MKFRTMALLTLNLLSVAALGRGAAHGQEARVSEYELKAVFLYNFAKFVEWPAEAFPEKNSPLVIGVAGENPFGNHLERIVQNKPINGHPIAVRYLEDLSAATNCHVLFIKTDRRRTEQFLKALGPASVLTVSDTKGFLDAGGMINFFLEGQRVRFEINNENARRAGLRLSSKLLSLGKEAE